VPQDDIDRADGMSTPMRRRRTYSVVSTFPPTPCGVATFSAALCDGLSRGGDDVTVIRVGGAGAGRDSRVVASLSDRSPTPSPEAVDALARADVVVLQHEYGLYAGKDGDSVIGLLDAVDAPTIVVAHTVLRSPTPHQRAVLEEVVRAADAVVVMTEAGRRLLVGGFDVDATKVLVIPHGAAVAPHTDDRYDVSSRKILTWGLLGPGKGIEWAVDALALLDDLGPRATYRVAGDTHPKVAAVKGEVYRDMLRRRAADAGLAGHVSFDAGYRGLDALGDLISTASVVVLPYDSPDQVTSGVLVDAVAAGRPVVATAFPHAVELLASGAGIVVPRRDPAALASALRRVLTEPGLADGMAREARRLAPELAWPAVASRYAALGDSLLERQTVLA
jgi:glycosyltransferase involved in cell wall biosynthesis